MKIDSFAHVLLPDFYQQMLAIEPSLPERFPFIQHPHLRDMKNRRQFWDGETKQVIAMVNINPEDYVGPKEAASLCRQANQEMLQLIEQEADLFLSGVAMIPMNNVPAALEIIRDQVLAHPSLSGIQLFTRALGQSLAHPDFEPIFELCHQQQVPIWLHPIFDDRKPDNNIVFSWEYELTQTMLELVQAGHLTRYPDLKILVHHAGAMVPYFAERINHILPADQAQAFRRFYVDTALLGNSKALALALDYYGPDQLLFGTDAPLGIAPAGAGQAIITAIEDLPISQADKEKIFRTNAEAFIGRH